MKKTLRYFISILSLSLIFFCFKQPPSFVDELIALTDSKMYASPKETVFIHTDRNSYQPTDTLWLKGYINDYTFGTPSLVSQTLFVDIVDNNNHPVLSREFYIDKGAVEGTINIPSQLDDGEYNLVAYTSMMKNHGTEWYYVKPIYLKNLKIASQIIPNLNLKITFDKKAYKSGEDVVAKLSFIKRENEGFNKTILEYAVKSNNKTLKSFKSEAINFGDVHIRFKMLENPQHVSIDVKVKNRDQSLSYSSLVPVKRDDVIVSFFPEGGEIVRNVKNKVAFLATDSLENSVDIIGDLVDEDGNKVLSIKAEHNGLGTFTFVPIKANKYFLSINDRLIPLPKAKKKGVTLSIQSDRKNTLAIRLNSTIGHPEKTYVVATMRDKVYWGIEGILDKTALVEIPLNDMPKGVLQITLFDEYKQPQAERLYFINKHKRLRIDIVTNKKSFNMRDSVALKINVRDHLNNPIKTEISLAATDVLFEGNKQNNHYYDIDNYFSLSSQLHGNWKTMLNQLPVWNEEKTNRVIDLMLLTYGWRKFEWDKLSAKDTVVNYELIHGRMTKGKKKVFKDIPVNLIAFNSNQILTTNTDSSGYFNFNKTRLNKSSTSFIITAAAEKNLPGLTVSMIENAVKQPKFIRTVTNQIQYSSTLRTPDKNLEVTDFNQYKILQEVIIKEKKLTEKEDPILQRFSTGNVSSKSGEELTSTPDIVGLIRQVTPILSHSIFNKSIILSSRGTPPAPALFVLDGIVIGNTYSTIQDYSVESIEYLTVLKGFDATFLYGPNAKGGVIFITTKYVQNDKEAKTSKNIVLLAGYSKHRVFYSPKYKSEEEKNSPFPDLRKTIYWNPKVVTNDKGEALVNYYNADRESTINISIHGMSNNGLYGSRTSSYEVSSRRK